MRLTNIAALMDVDPETDPGFTTSIMTKGDFINSSLPQQHDINNIIAKWN